MAAMADTLKSEVWLERSKYEEAEYKYQEYLVRNKQVSVTGGGSAKLTNGVAKKASEDKKGNLSQQIQDIRENLHDTLQHSNASGDSADSVQQQVEKILRENEKLQNEVSRLTKQFTAMESRISALENGTPVAQTEQKPVQNGTAKAVEEEEEDSDSDVDLFGSSDEEEDAEAARIREERLAAYKDKKSKKPGVIAKSSIMLDVKPWDDETDMAEMEKLIRTIEMDGLLWGGSKLVKVAFGIQKLQITCVVEDDKVGTDDLEEKITAFEELVQSVDIAAFNKI